MNSDKNKKHGYIYLAGAGPGDPELVTVKCLEALEKCDIVVYDNLVPAEILIGIPAHIEKIYVGKKANKHSLPQPEINKLLVKLASVGKTVVRLKGGDPYIFGRGGEEAQFLRDNDIKFEVIPGITAGAAAAAYAYIPCTDRRLASSVTFMTGHKSDDKESDSVDWDSFAKLKSGTLVVYMGVGEFAKIAEKLIELGKNPDTPAAAIERGTLPTSRTVKSTLQDLPEKCREKNIKPPTIFVIGDVVSISDKLEHSLCKPLDKLRIMVTRPADQAQDMYRALRLLGAEVLPYPTISTRPADESFDLSLLTQKADDRDRWLIFTSENGVRYFMIKTDNPDFDIRTLARFKIAAVGYGTARALASFKLRADFIPQKATTRSMAEELAATYDLKGAQIIRVRGNLADDRVEQILTESGAEVIPCPTYETFHPEWPDNFKSQLFSYPPDVIIFTSGSTATGLSKCLSEDEIKTLTDGKIIVSIGPSTSEIVKSLGMDVSLEADRHNIPGVINKLIKYYGEEK